MSIYNMCLNVTKQHTVYTSAYVYIVWSNVHAGSSNVDVVNVSLTAEPRLVAAHHIEWWKNHSITNWHRSKSNINAPSNTCVVSILVSIYSGIARKIKMLRQAMGCLGIGWNCVWLNHISNVLSKMLDNVRVRCTDKQHLRIFTYEWMKVLFGVDVGVVSLADGREWLAHHQQQH